MVDIRVEVEGVNYAVKYELQKELNEAKFTVWVDKDEPFTFFVRGYHVGTTIMSGDSKMSAQPTEQIVKEVRRHAQI